MKRFEDRQYIIIARGSKFADTGEIIKDSDIVYYINEFGNIEEEDVLRIVNNTEKHYIFYSTWEACKKKK